VLTRRDPAHPMAIPAELEALARTFAEVSPSTLHRLKLDLAKLVMLQAPPSAQNQLALAERFLEGGASAEALSDARQDAWAYIGSLACYCSATDSASAQAVLSCLESDAAAHTPQSLREQLERVLRCGVAQPAIARVLKQRSDQGKT